MPSGEVLLHDHEGPYARERFSCAERADGWSWTSTRADPVTGTPLGELHLRVDAQGVTRRLHVEAGPWVLRGGCVGAEALWRRGDEEREQSAEGFWGTSPAYALAAVRRLGGLAVGERQRLRLVAVLEPVLATRSVDTSWARTADTTWEVDDLGTGERRRLEVRDGLPVAGTGLTFTLT